MEFKCLKNLESNFQNLRLYALICVGACVLITICSVVAAFSYAEKQRHKIYVLDQGKSLILALAQSAAENRPVEAKEHIRRFHELFFTYAPDKAAIESNISRALVMADNSPVGYYKVLLEERYFTELIAGNINQSIRVDSIKCNFDTHPYKAVAYSTQKIIRRSTTTERSLITTCSLLNTVKSDDNPQGFMIENFRILENKDTAVYEK